MRVNKMVTLFRDLRRQFAFLTWTFRSVFPTKVAVICSSYLDVGSALLISEANMQRRETIAEVLDQKYASVIDPRSSFSDRGLSHRTFDQVIDTKIWLVVGPRSLVLGNQRLLVLN